ncbi:MAG: glycosyltransferase [bacterium]|nr:glycosyltransferase [bacterium]MDA1024422.1 glycosyltransferase [bacterium]
MTYSIVIPTLNEVHSIPRLLESINCQTLRPKQVIIADAGSDDGTREIVESFGATIVPGGLPGEGRNRGASVVSADLILFLDADTILLQPDLIASSIAEMQKRNLDIVSCDVWPIEAGLGSKIGHYIYNSYVRMMAKIHPHIPGFFILVKKDLHDAIDGFDETVVFCEDHDYGLRAAKIGRFGYLERGKRIHVSTRRFKRDGILRSVAVYVLAEIHIWHFGPIRTNLFEYGFGHNEAHETHSIDKGGKARSGS